MLGYCEESQNAEKKERDYLNNKSIPVLKNTLLDLVNNIEISYNKELLIDIIVDMKKENGEIPS